MGLRILKPRMPFYLKNSVKKSFPQTFKKYLKIALLVFLVLFFASLTRNIAKIRASGGKIGLKAQEVKELELQQEELQKELARIESAEYIEKQLRDNLGYSKEGEIIIVLPEDEILREIGKLKVENIDALPDPNWVRWAKLFEIQI